MSLSEKTTLSRSDRPGEDGKGLRVESQSAEEMSTSDSSVPAGPPARELKPLSWFLVVFALLAALFLFALDNTIVANVQENIIYTLGGIDKLPWISVAFALGAVATNLFWYVLKFAFSPLPRLEELTRA